jgi:hypothetical protein
MNVYGCAQEHIAQKATDEKDQAEPAGSSVGDHQDQQEGQDQPKAQALAQV